MTGAVILVLYTIVGTISAGSSSVVQHDWRPIGTFVDMAACKEAERLLGTPSRTRCLPGAAQ